MPHSLLESPLGEIFIAGDEDGLTALYLSTGRHLGQRPELERRDDAFLRAARTQLAEYFGGERQVFDLVLNARGTEFQRRVWRALGAIAFGQTSTYGRQAAAIGSPTASRAVGLANGQNPISIIVPCHRVIGANGSLTGYGGGLPAKRWLLAHEQAHTDSAQLQLQL
jgi:methylated-DNA-[protein]-cysteine S-methyltransferase